MIFSPEVDKIFEQYERLCAQCDELFGRVQEQFPSEVVCQHGCNDCCHAMFDLSLVEAMYINRSFAEAFDFGSLRSSVLEAAGEADRQAARLKRQYFLQSKQGLSDAEIMAQAAHDRIRCPLLGANQGCLLHDQRPITCRLYGVPTAIAGQAHVCPKSRFRPGGAYPTVALDRIQDRLAALSAQLTEALGSRFKELHKVYVPLSMALLTRYDEDYLGLGEAVKED